MVLNCLKQFLNLRMPSNHLSIKSWDKSDRPREKFLDKGPAYLSDSELLALFLGTGSKNTSAIDLAKQILASVNNNIKDLKSLSAYHLQQIDGVGKSKAVNILALVEFCNRYNDALEDESPTVSSSHDVFRLIKTDISRLAHEEFWVLYLNNANKLLKKHCLSKGGISATLIDTRLLLKSAILCGATSLILIHNHPSGSVKPSHHDRQITVKIKEACEKLDLKVLDHLIVSEKMYFSFADENIL